MQKNLLIISFFLSLFFSSCSIYENIYFLEDGSIKYQMTFDADEMIKMVPDMSMSSPTDSTSSIKEALKESGLSLIDLTEDDKDDLENISPLFINIKSNKEEKSMKISLYGDFASADALNNAFTSLLKLSKKSELDKVKTSPDTPLNPKSFKELNFTSRYFWDGRKMSRSVDVDVNSEIDETNESEPSEMNDALLRLFTGGKMTIKYHFPNKVKSVSDSDALFTQDGKTVIIEYPAQIIAKPTQDLDVEIVTE